MYSHVKSAAPFIVFDIETIPDIPLLVKQWGLRNKKGEVFSALYPSWVDLDIETYPENLWDNIQFWEAFSAFHEVTFPQVLFHVVLCVCAFCVDPSTYRIVDSVKLTMPRVSTYAQAYVEEKRIINEFWLSLCRWRAPGSIPVTLCGYNISTFDLPVLEQRSLVHWVSCPLPEYASSLGPQSYRYKYGSDKVFDLLAFVANYDNRNAKVGLGILAKALGLAGKMEGMEGSQVFKEYCLTGDIKKIEEYCAIDVLVTLCVLLSVQHFRGVLKPDTLGQSVAHLAQQLQQPGRPACYKEFFLNSKSFFENATA